MVALFIVSIRTTYGRQVIAVGSYERAARLSGINVNTVNRRTYTLMGLMVCLFAILQVSRMG